jgi:uncharacterized protein (TIGR00730 family)
MSKSYSDDFSCERTLSTAKQDAANHTAHLKDNPQMQSPAYRLAYHDFDFMIRDELRPVRLQLELLKPELTLIEHGIEATVVIFGSARTLDAETAQNLLCVAEQALAENPDDAETQRAFHYAKKAVKKSHYYEQARQLANLITQRNSKQHPLVVITGGGGGIMEGANRGAFEAGGKSMGFNIVLPIEQIPNPYITPDLCFQFHYFAIRKMHLLMRAKALVAFPGGFGTLDELFEALTLIQTKKMRRIPIILFGKSYWQRVINFDVLVEEGAISLEDLALIQYAETAEDAWALI